MRFCSSLLGLMLALPLGLSAQNLDSPETPITNPERVRWLTDFTVGPISLGVEAVNAGWGTWLDRPVEYGTHWSGFAKRYGVGLSGVAASNAIEAGLGAITTEDPRYFPSAQTTTLRRVQRAARMTFMASYADGKVRPAYARYVGITGSNFLSNTWREHSESNISSALIRTGLGFASRFVGNLFEEFRGDLVRRGQ